MSRVPPTLGRLAGGAHRGTDAEAVDEAVRLIRATAGQPGAAKRYLIVWLLIQAHQEGTTLGAVLDKLVRTQPSRNDQYGLLRRLRARLDGEE